MKYIKFLTFIFLTLSLSSCKDKQKEMEEISADYRTNKELNTWTYENMDKYYYWYKDLPKANEVNYNSSPTNFFRILRSVFDRFSYIEGSDEVMSRAIQANYDIGFQYIAFSHGDQNANPYIYLFVTYVKNGSSAEGKIKRGDLITGVDGKEFRRDNFQSLLYSNSNPNLTVNYDNKVSILYHKDFQENPIHVSKIIEQGAKKIGYIVYNHFASGSENSNNKKWAIEMNNILKNFKEQGISELILDLRYNPGGYVESGTYIASAIAPARSGKIYTKRNYNDKLEKESAYEKRKNNYFADYIQDGNTKHEIPQLALSRLIVITSKTTASASEQIINGIGAYMPVEIVGETTVGKNMESFAIENKNSESTLVLHPETSISYNSLYNSPEQNDYSKGFKPTIAVLDEEIDEVSRGGAWEWYNSKYLIPPAKSRKALGDPDETLLSIALDFIKTGNREPDKTEEITRRLSLKPIKIDVSNNRIGGAIVATILE